VRLNLRHVFDAEALPFESDTAICQAQRLKFICGSSAQDTKEFLEPLSVNLG
jgi:hypothetical protein